MTRQRALRHRRVHRDRPRDAAGSRRTTGSRATACPAAAWRTSRSRPAAGAGNCFEGNDGGDDAAGGPRGRRAPRRATASDAVAAAIVLPPPQLLDGPPRGARATRRCRRRPRSPDAGRAGARGEPTSASRSLVAIGMPSPALVARSSRRLIAAPGILRRRPRPCRRRRSAHRVVELAPDPARVPVERLAADHPRRRPAALEAELRPSRARPSAFSGEHARRGPGRRGRMPRAGR